MVYPEDRILSYVYPQNYLGEPIITEMSNHSPVVLMFDGDLGMKVQLTLIDMFEKYGVSRACGYKRVYYGDEEDRRVLFIFNCPDNLLHLFNDTMVKLHMK